MSHENVPFYGQDSPLFTTTEAPWMPLDEAVTLWASFGHEATTAEAARATSEAFAALAEERVALHSYTIVKQQSQLTRRSQLVGLHQHSIEALIRAAAHWFSAASAVEEYVEQMPRDDGTEGEFYTFIRQALAERLRVWTIVKHLVHEQMTLYQQHNEGHYSCSGTSQREGMR